MRNRPDSPAPPEREAATPIERIAERVEEIRARNERLFEQVVEGEKRFRALARAVWKVQEEERRRLARELHDGVGQTLTALVNLLRRGPPGGAAAAPGAAPAAEDPLKVAELALRDVRELSRLLRPPVLDDLGLKPALQWLARTMRQQSGLVVSLDWQGGDERLDAELETLVFRVAQEALNNVVKHSGQGRARLAVRHGAGRIELEIADGGRGFDAERAISPAGGAAGLGLRGIRDRVELFGGRFTVRSAPGRGSELSVVVPLPEPTRG